jgi:sodium-dependent dicarboxylate transporter 2/3/5
MRAPLVTGPLWCLATVVVSAPFGLSEPSWHVAGVAGWMAIWWLTAVVPLEATALLPIVLLPLLDVAGVGDVTVSYADPIIFLFMGGFFLAAALERWQLHKRFALTTIRAVGTDAPKVVLAFMLASAIASMWISNTATAIMMLPVALAVVGGTATRHSGGTVVNGGFPTALLLGIAYASSIGGVSTLIGTPPNAIMAGAARELLGEDVSFAGWMAIALPIAIPMLAGCWLLLVKLFRVRGTIPGLAQEVDREHKALGRMSGGERFVVAVFALTAFAWIFRAPKSIGSMTVPGLSDLVPGISDAGIAVAAAVVLMVIPLWGQRFRTALDWDTARKVPWGILLLFGGGLALAGAFETSGLTEWLGTRLQGLRGVPFPLVIAVTAGLFVFLTELTSNTATAALGMPLMVGVADGLGLAALPLMTTAALAASMAFMLPVATPPNAIVFGSRVVNPKHMVRAGFGLNLLSVTIITLAIWIVGR